MSRHERTYSRDGAPVSIISLWHREESLSRFLKKEDAARCTMIDIDGMQSIEYGGPDRLPICVVEFKRHYKGNALKKTSTVLTNLANQADRQYKLWTGLDPSP